MFQSKYARGNKTGAQLKGLFENGQWKCDCSPRYPAISFEVKKPGPNQGKLFYTCAQEKRCGFFLWRHDAVVREGRAVLANSRTEPVGDKTTAGNRPGDTHNLLAGKPTKTPDAPRASLPPPQPPLPDREADLNLPEDTPSRSSRSFLGRNVSNGEETTSFELTSDEEKALADAERKITDGKLQQNQPQQSRSVAQPVAAAAAPAVPPIAAAAAPFTTPSKRKYADMSALESGSLPTPETHGKRQMTSATRSGSALLRSARAGDPAVDGGLDELLNLVSPQVTPTPASRFKDVGAAAPGAGRSDAESDDIWAAIHAVLQEERVELADGVMQRLQDVCTTHMRRNKGILQGRTILRKALNARDHRIALLVAELDVEREVIKVLRDQT